MRKINREQFNSQRPFDSGAEKRIWIDPQNPEQKVGIYHGEYRDAAQLMKGRFYLGKIMHLLCPDYIPDIHQASYDSNSLISDFVQGVNAETALSETSEDSTSKSEDQIMFKNLMKRFGILADDSIFNFVYDQEGRFFYVDTIEPWHNRKSRNYSLEALQTAIKKLGPQKRGEAFSYLNRLETLWAEHIKNKNN